ncbi:MAG: hypothetical protein OXC13_19515 [Caldilineaceae bacterium]|nr:hypothetical protein [Caldilineaceae bacterium]
MNAYRNSISFEDWLSEFPLEIQQAIQDGGEHLIARYETEAERAATVSLLYKQCEDAVAQLVVVWYKMGTYLNVCREGLEPEGYLHVLAASDISEQFAQTCLDLWEACNANPAIRDWIEVSDRASNAAVWDSMQLLSHFLALAKSHLSETEIDEAVLGTVAPRL